MKCAHERSPPSAHPGYSSPANAVPNNTESKQFQEVLCIISLILCSWVETRKLRSPGSSIKPDTSAGTVRQHPTSPRVRTTYGSTMTSIHRAVQYESTGNSAQGQPKAERRRRLRQLPRGRRHSSPDGASAGTQDTSHYIDLNVASLTSA